MFQDDHSPKMPVSKDKISAVKNIKETLTDQAVNKAAQEIQEKSSGTIKKLQKKWLRFRRIQVWFKTVLKCL